MGKETPGQICQKGLDKKQNGKGNAADKKHILGVVLRPNAGDKPKQKPGDAPSQNGAGGVGHQIVDIRGTEGEQL